MGRYILVTGESVAVIYINVDIWTNLTVETEVLLALEWLIVASTFQGSLMTASMFTHIGQIQLYDDLQTYCLGPFAQIHDQFRHE